MPHNPSNPDLPAHAREFIKGNEFVRLDRVYFAYLDEQPRPARGIHFFTVDTTLVYVNFYADFGPSNISHVIKFCTIMQEKLSVILIIDLGPGIGGQNDLPI